MPGSPIRVSVLLPAYDAERTLAAALDSVRRQSLADWECWVVDDGSTDRTPDVARRYGLDDPRFRLHSGPHEGLVAALNRGLERCRGEYVARMDADDLMHRRRLEEQAALLDARPELVATGCHVRLFPRAGLRDGARDYERWVNGIRAARQVREEAFVECPVVHPTLMIRRQTLRSLGYREMGWPEDYDLLLRLLADGREVGMLPRRRLCWRDRPGRLWRTAAAYRQERFTRCKAFFLAGGFLARGDRYILWGHGGTGRALRRELLAHGKRAAYIVELHPGRLGNRIDGAPVIPPEALSRVPRLPLVVSVAGAEARGQIRGALAAMGMRELRDFVCAA